MSEIPNVVPGEPVESVWGNSIRDRSITRYTDATNRDASIPVPTDGTPAWLTGPNELTVFDGTDWITIADRDYVDTGLAAKVNKSGDVMSGSLNFPNGSGIAWGGSVILTSQGNGVQAEGPSRHDWTIGAQSRLIVRNTHAQFGPDAGFATVARIHTEGSQTTPLYSARSFTSTGINIPSNLIEFVTLGQRRMYVDSAGNVFMTDLTEAITDYLMYIDPITGRLFYFSRLTLLSDIESRLAALEAFHP